MSISKIKVDPFSLIFCTFICSAIVAGTYLNGFPYLSLYLLLSFILGYVYEFSKHKPGFADGFPVFFGVILLLVIIVFVCLGLVYFCWNTEYAKSILHPIFKILLFIGLLAGPPVIWADDKF